MSSFCTAKATHIFFSKKYQNICVSLDVNFNESLTNDIVSFEQLGPDIFLISPQTRMLFVLIKSTLVPTTYVFVEKYGEIRKILHGYPSHLEYGIYKNYV